jgi:hypothetical protein
LSGRRISLDLASRLALVAALSGTLTVNGCRAIAGVNGDLVGVPGDAGHEGGHEGAQPDGAKKDSGRDSGAVCPNVTPTTVFTTQEAYGDETGGFFASVALLLTDSYVLLEIESADDDNDNDTAGLLACPKAGCNQTPTTLVLTVNDMIGDAGSDFGAATATATSALYSDNPFSGDASDDPSPYDAGTVVMLSPDGSGSMTIARGLACVDYLAVAGDSLLWMSDPYGNCPSVVGAANAWQLYRCPVAACTQSELFMAGQGNDTSLGVVADGVNAYVLDVNGPGETAAIVACALDGGCNTAPRVVASGLLINGTEDIGGSSSVDANDSFASDGSYLYVTSLETNEVRRIDLSSGASTTIASNLYIPTYLALDATYAYWSTSEGSIQRVRKDGTGAVETILCGLSFPAALAVDDTNVYVAVVDPNVVNPTAVISFPVPP